MIPLLKKGRKLVHILFLFLGDKKMIKIYYIGTESRGAKVLRKKAVRKKTFLLAQLTLYGCSGSLKSKFGIERDVRALAAPVVANKTSRDTTFKLAGIVYDSASKLLCVSHVPCK